MKSIRFWAAGVSLLAALSLGGGFTASIAEAQPLGVIQARQTTVLANALISFRNGDALGVDGARVASATHGLDRARARGHHAR